MEEIIEQQKQHMEEIIEHTKADAAIADAADQRFQKVSGTISRPISHGGARFQLFKLACPGGLYPPELDAETAFETVASSQVDRSILRFSVVFTTIDRATKFVSEVEMYLLHNKMDLELLDDQGSKTDHLTVTEIAPFAITFQNSVLLSHYKPRTGEAEPISPPIDMVVETRSFESLDDVTLLSTISPLIDMVVETRSFESLVDVTLLSTTDTTFRFQRIETDSSFTLAAPESAHIFPSAQCTGKYRWLDAPEYNRLALSRDVHVNFDGTGRGRGKRRKTVQTFAIKPVRPEGGFTISIIDGCPCFRIPLELEFNNNGIAAGLLPKLGNNAILNKNQGARWTITGADVHVFYPQDHRVTLITEVKDSGDLDLVTAIPGVENLNECWSNSQDDLYSLAAAEILEKCLLWNYRNALEKWRLI